MTPGDAGANPALGVLIFAIGGLAGAVFYLPFRKVRDWAWESYWLVYAVSGLLVVPLVLALATSPNLLAVLRAAPRRELLYCYLCGAMWGIGGLTWGLMIRYLGVGLGLALGCGITSAAGTLVPRLLAGDVGRLFEPGAGIVSFIGVLLSLAGIVTVGLAGMSKERELPDEEKRKSVAEFDFGKGVRAALFSGLMSAAMGWGLVGGPTIQKLAETTQPITSRTWSGMPVLVVVLLGGLTVNLAWCLFLNARNRTTGDYANGRAPLARNFAFAAVAGAIWCSQFVCFKTGEPAMGRTAYVGWALLMACQILFSSLVGAFVLGEWRATGGRTRALLGAGLALLVLTAVLTGVSGYLALAS
jgi:L-rhamnose-H+ transport protein